MAKKQSVVIPIPKGYSPATRKAIAIEIMDFIRNRTESGKNIQGRPWAGKSGQYSKPYLAMRKRVGLSTTVNLSATGDMLAAMEVLKDTPGKIEIGYEDGSQMSGQVEGNRLGTYGRSSPIRGKKRDFLGITKADLNKKILAHYPLKNKEKLEERTQEVLAIDQAAEDFTGSTEIEDIEDE